MRGLAQTMKTPSDQKDRKVFVCLYSASLKMSFKSIANVNTGIYIHSQVKDKPTA